MAWPQGLNLRPAALQSSNLLTELILPQTLPTVVF